MIEYKTPRRDELSDLCELNDYLFYLSKENFDPTLSQDWHDGNSYERYFSQYFKEGNYVYAAYVGERMIGYITGKIEEMSKDSYRGKQKIGVLENLMVLPEYQGEGVGRELTDLFKKWAKAEGCNRVQVCVYRKNTKAIDFYRKLGFDDYDMNLEVEV